MITLQERVHGHPPPDAWQLNKLHRVLKVRKGFKNTGMQEENLLSLSYGNIIRKDIDSSEGLLPESFETYQIVEPGNIVLRLTDLQNDKRSLRQGLVRERGIVTSAYDALQVEKDHDPRFWAYALLALDLAKYYYSLGGGVRQSIKFADFPNDWLRAPNLEAQKAIADFLDQETARIDHLIIKKNRMSEALQEREALMVDQHFFASSTADLGWKRFSVPFPRRGACYKKLSYVCELLRDGTHQPPPRVDDGIPLLSVRNIIDGEFVLRDDDSKISQADYAELCRSFEVRAGDVILAIIGATLGKVAVVGDMPPIHIQRSVAIIRPKTAEISAEYLATYFRSRFFQQLLWLNSSFSAQPGVYLSTLGQLPVPVTSRELQRSIVTQVSNSAMRIADIRKRLAASRRGLEEFRSSLITAGVTGQIDVAAWGKRGRTQRQLDEIEKQPLRNEARA